MRKTLQVLLVTSGLCWSCIVGAHGGGLDARGCHEDRSTGTVHCHQKPDLLKVEKPELDKMIYQRSDYGGWVDQDGDCQDTRQEVLIENGTDLVLDEDGCRVFSGRWVGPYTGSVYDDPGDLHIDHVVPLKEAHRSGAAHWPPEKKARFANAQVNLLPVNAGENMSKGARDPAQWLPERNRCSYLERWHTVKDRWNLSMDAKEEALMEKAQSQCRW